MDVTSHDGTTIAFERTGGGPPLIFVDGALMVRGGESRPELAALLAPHFTVYSYDRRGRGASSDTLPYAAEREIDDLAALIDRAGGRAHLAGFSSGACLALEAAAALGPGAVATVVAYEAPWNDDPAAQEPWSDYLAGLDAALRRGRRGDAVALFIGSVGTPVEQVEAMRGAPFWPALEEIAPTLAYDHAGVMGPRTAVPRELLSGVTVPVLAVCGSASFPFMCATAHTIAESVPRGRQRTLEGQTHAVKPAAFAPVVIEFLEGTESGTRAA
jgi:pimeloyl-ACP methyl ester carboxylesterase